MEIYAGEKRKVEKPKLRKDKYNKDFSSGFYCTKDKTEAKRKAKRYGKGYLNTYKYHPNPSLKVLKFEKMDNEWLEFIVSSRKGIKHKYDIVEGPMVDEKIFSFEGFISGLYIREMFFAFVKSVNPKEQISYNSKKGLETLEFKKALRITNI